jgi:hypothetical protein
MSLIAALCLPIAYPARDRGARHADPLCKLALHQIEPVSNRRHFLAAHTTYRGINQLSVYENRRHHASINPKRAEKN